MPSIFHFLYALAFDIHMLFDEILYHFATVSLPFAAKSDKSKLKKENNIKKPQTKQWKDGKAYVLVCVSVLFIST